MNAPVQLSRRALLAGGGALVIGVMLPTGFARAQTAPIDELEVDPNAFIRVAPDSTITVLIKHIEFGQGPNTGLSTLVADEMDADWAQMRAESAPGNPKLYANLMFKIQMTGGSSGMANSYEQMRKAGALARLLLVQAAAARWGVPAGEIAVSKGLISHASGKSGPFGDFAADAAKLTAPKTVKLKDASQFRYIGKDKSVRRLDSAAKSDGTANFTLDIYEEGMQTVLLARPPRFGGTVGKVDAKAALAVPGVKAVRAVSSGVAVYADGMWAAMKGRDALKVTWDDSKAETRGSEEMIAQYLATAKKPGAVAGSKGELADAFKGAEVVEADYVFPYLAHGPMEPLDGYIDWDGKVAKTRFGSQGASMDMPALAQVLGIEEDAVKIDVMLTGGSFGRRTQSTSHFAAELGEVAKAAGPGKYKLVWTREDDIRGGYYRPIMVHHMKGAIKGGKIVGWANTMCGQSIALGTPMAASMLKDGIDPLMVEGSREIPYLIPAFQCDAHMDPTPVRTLWWRAVGHTHTGYAVECFVDTLLAKLGKDPVAGRLELMDPESQFAGVLRKVAQMADWKGGKVADGRARGVAVVKAFNTYAAQIVEISMSEDGEPRVHKVWCAVDCGLVVNPDIVRAQMEGGIGYGLGHALYAEVPLKAGEPTVSNFDGYRSLRINEMPQVEVAIIPSTKPPTGVGEPGVAPIAPALANAMAALGEARPSRLPVVRVV